MSGKKKFFGIGLLALLTTAYFTSSCSRDDFSGSVIDAKKATFNDNFIAEYGQIDPNHDWGFGLNGTRAFTRAVQTPYVNDDYAGNGLTKPTDFTDETPTSRKPAKSTVSFTYPVGTKGSSEKYPLTDITDNDTFVITEAYMAANGEWAPYGLDGKKNLTIYIDGNVTCHGATYQNSDGIPTYIVTTNSTLKFKNIRPCIIYLAPSATLDLDDLEWATCQNNCAIYMSEESAIYAQTLQIEANGKILNEGGTIDVGNLILKSSSVLWNEGELTVDYNVKLTDNDCLLYNADGNSITVGSLDVLTDRCVVYNEGDFTCDGHINLSDGASEFSNGITGELTAASISLLSTSKMYNAGTTTIYGKTLISNKTNKWLNEGLYTSGDFEVTGFDTTGTDVWNNCKLVVTATGTGMTGTGNFHLNRGVFIIEGGATAGGSLVCDSFTWEDTSGFYLGSKSMVNVTGNIYTKNYNSGYGFHGFGQDYAVIRAASITKSGDNQFSMSYYGNLYVDIPIHFEQGYLDTPNTNQPYYSYEESVKFGPESNSPVSIEPSNCNDGYNWNEEIILLQSGRVFCEDLGTVDISDIDYNDVVFDAWLYVKRTNQGDVFDKCVIQLLAAGGTIPVQVAGVNVHEAFGVAEDVMVNTVKEGVGKLNSDVKHAEYGVDFNKMPDKIVITSPALLTGTDGSINIKNIPIVVRTNNTAIELTFENSTPGTTAPLKFMAPIGTAWAAERVKIGEAYPYFSVWVQNRNQVPWSYCVEDNVYTDKDYGLNNLTFRTEDYCKAEWDAGSSTFTWGQDNKGWDDAWTFMAAQGVSGDLSDWMLLHLKVSDFTNASAEKLTVVFKKNDGSTPPNGPTKEFVVSPDVLGNIDIPLYGVQWGNCDIKNIQDLTIYGCDRDDNTIPASVKVTEAYYVKF